MDYYEKKRRVGKDLETWVKNSGRCGFAEFGRVKLSEYGFDCAYLEKLLKANYPEFMIKNDKLVKRS